MLYVKNICRSKILRSDNLVEREMIKKSISLPKEINDWVRRLSIQQGVPMNSLYVLAIGRLREELEGNITRDEELREVAKRLADIDRRLEGIEKDLKQ